MFNPIDKFISKRHDLIVEKSNVMEILEIINGRKKWYIDIKLSVGNCGWADDITKWYVTFNASNDQWKNIINDLNGKGYKLYIKDHTSNVYLSKKIEP